MPALQAHAQMQPLLAKFHALFAPLCLRFHLLQVFRYVTALAVAMVASLRENFLLNHLSILPLQPGAT